MEISCIHPSLWKFHGQIAGAIFIGGQIAGVITGTIFIAGQIAPAITPEITENFAPGAFVPSSSFPAPSPEV